MAEHTAIEWTDATWNPITGCSVISPGCTNCYAMKLAGGRLRHHPTRQSLTQASKAGPVWTGEVRFNEQQLLEPLNWKRPRKIFVCAHGDLFHESVPDEWIDKIFAVMTLAPQHTFQVLTKRADRMRAYFAGISELPNEPAARDALIEGEAQALHHRRTGEDPSLWLAVHMPLPNVWLGVSAEDQARLDDRAPSLLATPAAVRFLSAEPLLSPLDVRAFLAWSGGAGRSWSSFTWPAWIPVRVRHEVEDFWKTEHGRGPGAWIRGGLNNGQPPLGTVGQFHLCGPDEQLVTGRFIPAWNNIGRVLDSEGQVHVVSAGMYQGKAPKLDWVIVGGESGPDARPMHPAWARQIRDDCAAADVAFFFKQWGAFAPQLAVEEPHGPLTFMDAAGVKAPELCGDDRLDIDTAWIFERVGKKAAGRLLDGREHNAMPGAA